MVIQHILGTYRTVHKTIINQFSFDIRGITNTHSTVLRIMVYKEEYLEGSFAIWLVDIYAYLFEVFLCS